jgi:hypothetical protein
VIKTRCGILPPLYVFAFVKPDGGRPHPGSINR